MEWQPCASSAISAFRHRNGIIELVFVEGRMVRPGTCDRSHLARHAWRSPGGTNLHQMRAEAAPARTVVRADD
jgi:hypothetical protein